MFSLSVDVFGLFPLSVMGGGFKKSLPNEAVISQSDDFSLPFFSLLPSVISCKQEGLCLMLYLFYEGLYTVGLF